MCIRERCYIAAEKLNKDSSELIFDVIKNSNDKGIKSSQDYFNQINIDLTDAITKLNYPSDRRTNPVSLIFNELFYGPELYNKIFNKKKNILVMIRELWVSHLFKKWIKLLNLVKEI